MARNSMQRQFKIGWARLAEIGALAVLLAGCGSSLPGAAPATPTPQPQAATALTVSATGRVVPVRSTTLSFVSAGPVVSLLVQEGDAVKTGDVLARLDTTILDAGVASAQAALGVAQANLARVQAGAHPEQIAAAQDTAAAANAQTAAAGAQRDVVSAGAEQSQLLQAQSAVQTAKLQLDAIMTELNYIIDVETNPNKYDPAVYHRIMAAGEWDARNRVAEAQAAYDAAVAKLNAVQAGPNPNDVRAASADLWAASADYNAQQAQVNVLQGQPLAEDVAAAQAQVTVAQAALDQAKLARQHAELTAPFDGTISAVAIQPAQYVTPGQPIVILADLGALQIETTDLSETDIASVAVGDTATITFDALPDAQVTGTVIRIAPKASEGTGVNYTVTLTPNSLPDAVRWGMTAFVDIPQQ